MSPVPPPAASAASASPSTTAAGSTLPPPNFKLAELRLQLTRQAPQGLAPMQRISFTGLGNGTLQVGDNSQPFNYSAEELLAHVNALYTLNFFHLPTRYSNHASVFLRPDGSVGQSLTRMLDVQSTELCFTLPSYQKCVSYDHLQKPAELEAAVQQMIKQAEQRSQR